MTMILVFIYECHWRYNFCAIISSKRFCFKINWIYCACVSFMHDAFYPLRLNWTVKIHLLSCTDKLAYIFCTLHIFCKCFSHGTDGWDTYYYKYTWNLLIFIGSEIHFLQIDYRYESISITAALKWVDPRDIWVSYKRYDKSTMKFS